MQTSWQRMYTTNQSFYVILFILKEPYHRTSLEWYVLLWAVMITREARLKELWLYFFKTKFNQNKLLTKEWQKQKSMLIAQFLSSIQTLIGGQILPFMHTYNLKDQFAHQIINYWEKVNRLKSYNNENYCSTSIKRQLQKNTLLFKI